MPVVVGQQGMSLIDLAKMTGSGGDILSIAEVLNKKISVASVPFKQGNTEDGNEYTVRTALPDVGTRAAGEGSPLTNASQGQGKDTQIHIEANGFVDAITYDRSSNKAKTLANENAAFIQAMGEKFFYEMFYGDKSKPTSTMKQRFDGFATRFGSSVTYKPNVKKAGGSSNLTSIYMPIWGENACYGFAGKNYPAGLIQGPTTPFTITKTNATTGEVTVQDGYRTKFEWYCGLTIENWRQFARLGNIDYTALKKDSSAGADLIEGMILLTRAVQDLSAGRATFYMNRDVISYLDLQHTYKNNVLLTPMDVVGRAEQVDTFRRIPVIMSDSIANDETAVA